MINPGLKHTANRSDPVENPCAGDQFAEDCSVELHLRELTQLFDSRDPSPFHEKDLDSEAEEYIVESVKEQSRREQIALVISVDQSANVSDEATVVEDAIRFHFSRRAQLSRRKLRHLIRRGLVSLGIGLSFLAIVFMMAQALGRHLEGGGWATLLREGLIIVGWVAMWRPLDIFLYDWWPLLGEQRLYERLSRIKVRIVYMGLAPSATDAEDIGVRRAVNRAASAGM